MFFMELTHGVSMPNFHFNPILRNIVGVTAHISASYRSILPFIDYKLRNISLQKILLCGGIWCYSLPQADKVIKMQSIEMQSDYENIHTWSEGKFRIS